MAKKLGEVTNPLTAQGGSVLSPSDWISRILFVAWIGAIFAIGSKLLAFVDNYVPGNNTPTGMANATTVVATGETTIQY